MTPTIMLAAATSLCLLATAYYSKGNAANPFNLINLFSGLKSWLMSEDDLASEKKILALDNDNRRSVLSTESLEDISAAGNNNQSINLAKMLQQIWSHLKKINPNTLTRWPTNNKEYDFLQAIEKDSASVSKSAWQQKIYAGISSAIDSTSQFINKIIGDKIKQSEFQHSLGLSGINIFAGFVRSFIQRISDTKKVDAWQEYARDMRSKAAEMKNADSHFDGTVATTRIDEIYMNHNDYQSTLLQSAIGIGFGLYSVVEAGIKFSLLLPLMAATTVRMAACSAIDRVGTKLQDIHNERDKNLQNELQNVERGSQLTANIKTLFAIHQRTYNKRVIVETISAVTGKVFDAFMKWGLLRSLLKSLLQGQIAYTALIPTLMLMNNFSKSINVPASTNKSVNAFINARNAIQTEKDSKTENLARESQTEDPNSPDSKETRPFLQRLLKQTGLKGIIRAAGSLNMIDKASKQKIVCMIAVFFILQLVQCLLGIQSFELLRTFSQAISVHNRAASIHILKQMLYLDLAIEFVKGAQRWLIRFTCSSWAQELREDYAQKIIDAETSKNKGELIVNDIKALIDMSGELVNQYSIAILNVTITAYSIINCTFTPWLMIGAAAIVGIKTILLLCNDREAQQSERALARDNIKSGLMSSQDMKARIEHYNKTASQDYLGDYVTTNLSNLMNALVAGFQNFGFSLLIQNNQMPKTDFSSVMGKSSNIFSGMDTINNNNFNANKLAVAESRLDSVDFLTTKTQGGP